MVQSSPDVLSPVDDMTILIFSPLMSVQFIAITHVYPGFHLNLKPFTGQDIPLFFSLM